ncbi:hypothetical protein IWX91DRAFT_341773, partial [Phyllosticta citricarpa]
YLSPHLVFFFFFFLSSLLYLCFPLSLSLGVGLSWGSGGRTCCMHLRTSLTTSYYASFSPFHRYYLPCCLLHCIHRSLRLLCNRHLTLLAASRRVASHRMALGRWGVISISHLLPCLL